MECVRDICRILQERENSLSIRIIDSTALLCRLPVTNASVVTNASCIEIVKMKMGQMERWRSLFCFQLN